MKPPKPPKPPKTPRTMCCVLLFLALNLLIALTTSPYDSRDWDAWLYEYTVQEDDIRWKYETDEDNP